MQSNRLLSGLLTLCFFTLQISPFPRTASAENVQIGQQTTQQATVAAGSQQANTNQGQTTVQQDNTSTGWLSDQESALSSATEADEQTSPNGNFVVEKTDNNLINIRRVQPPKVFTPIPANVVSFSVTDKAVYYTEQAGNQLIVRKVNYSAPNNVITFNERADTLEFLDGMPSVAKITQNGQTKYVDLEDTQEGNRDWVLIDNLYSSPDGQFVITDQQKELTIRDLENRTYKSILYGNRDILKAYVTSEGIYFASTRTGDLSSSFLDFISFTKKTLQPVVVNPPGAVTVLSGMFTEFSNGIVKVLGNDLKIYSFSLWVNDNGVAKATPTGSPAQNQTPLPTMLAIEFINNTANFNAYKTTFEGLNPAAVVQKLYNDIYGRLPNSEEQADADKWISELSALMNTSDAKRKETAVAAVVQLFVLNQGRAVKIGLSPNGKELVTLDPLYGNLLTHYNVALNNKITFHKSVSAPDAVDFMVANDAVYAGSPNFLYYWTFTKFNGPDRITIPLTGHKFDKFSSDGNFDVKTNAVPPVTLHADLNLTRETGQLVIPGIDTSGGNTGGSIGTPTGPSQTVGNKSVSIEGKKLFITNTATGQKLLIADYTGTGTNITDFAIVDAGVFVLTSPTIGAENLNSYVSFIPISGPNAGGAFTKGTARQLGLTVEFSRNPSIPYDLVLNSVGTNSVEVIYSADMYITKGSSGYSLYNFSPNPSPCAPGSPNCHDETVPMRYNMRFTAAANGQISGQQIYKDRSDVAVAELARGERIPFVPKVTNVAIVNGVYQTTPVTYTPNQVLSGQSLKNYLQTQLARFPAVANPLIGTDQQVLANVEAQANREFLQLLLTTAQNEAMPAGLDAEAQWNYLIDRALVRLQPSFSGAKAKLEELVIPGFVETKLMAARFNPPIDANPLRVTDRGLAWGHANVIPDQMAIALADYLKALRKTIQSFGSGTATLHSRAYFDSQASPPPGIWRTAQITIPASAGAGPVATGTINGTTLANLSNNLYQLQSMDAAIRLRPELALTGLPSSPNNFSRGLAAAAIVISGGRAMVDQSTGRSLLHAADYTIWRDSTLPNTYAPWLTNLFYSVAQTGP